MQSSISSAAWSPGEHLKEIELPRANLQSRQRLSETNETQKLYVQRKPIGFITLT